MASITATYAKNNIGNVWEMVKSEPVEVFSNGMRVAVILSPQQFDSMAVHSTLGRPRRLGWFENSARDFDSDAFLNTDISEVFSEYTQP